MPTSQPDPSLEWQPPRRTGGISVASGGIAPDTRFRGHDHDGVHLCCVVGGGFVESTPAGPADVGPGTVRLSSSARHDIDFAPVGASCVVIQLDGPAAAMVGPLPSRPRFLADEWLRALTARLGVVASRRGHIADLEVDGAVVELLAQIARRHTGAAAGAPPAWLRRAREMVFDLPPRLQSLSVIAASVGVHRVHLARAFRDHYGEPIGSAARRLRLQRALRLLDGELPLAQVALEAGYADQSHLTREITRRLGLPPAHLRRRAATPVQDRYPSDAQIRDKWCTPTTRRVRRDRSPT